jgi:hypothetical protein
MIPSPRSCLDEAEAPAGSAPRTTGSPRPPPPPPPPRRRGRPGCPGHIAVRPQEQGGGRDAGHLWAGDDDVDPVPSPRDRGRDAGVRGEVEQHVRRPPPDQQVRARDPHVVAKVGRPPSGPRCERPCADRKQRGDLAARGDERRVGLGISRGCPCSSKDGDPRPVMFLLVTLTTSRHSRRRRPAERQPPPQVSVVLRIRPRLG